MSVSQQEYDPLEDPLYVHGPIYMAISWILIDRILALTFWGNESNPVVIELGLFRWLWITGVLIIAMLYVWYIAEGVDQYLVRIFVWLIAIGHFSMVLMNLAVVLFS